MAESSKVSEKDSKKFDLFSIMEPFIRKTPKKIMIPAKEAEEKSDEGSIYTNIPPITDPNIDILEIKPVIEDFAYARIIYDNANSEYIYEAIEPQLNDKEKEYLTLIKDSLSKTMDYEWEKLADHDKREYLVESIESFIKSRNIELPDVSREKVMYYLVRDFIGYGRVDILMKDDDIEDISCDGTNIPIFIFHKKYESIKTTVKFEEDEILDSFIISLGQRCGKNISVATPILDGTSKEGHRIQATYSHEVTTRGSSFTIRRFKEKPFTPVELVKFKTASPEMIAYLWMMVENGKSLIVCGGTACGKTATLNAISLFIPPGAKIVTMEDTREINLPHENWIPGATRSGVGERGADGKAAGEIDMYDLVRAALRQRPNYIIVGEVRGKETYTMFQAMATGHTTYTTMHADSVKSMVHRLENPPINTPRILLTALNLVIIQSFARLKDQQVRRIKEIVEIVGFEAETNELVTNQVYAWNQITDSFIYKGHSFILDAIMEMKNMTHEDMQNEMDRRTEVIEYMVKKDITDYREIAKIITAYYKDPEETIDRIREELAEEENES